MLWISRAARGRLCLFLSGFCLYSFIFAPGGKAAADMPLGLVEIQQLTHLPIQARIHMRQTFCQILMYGGLRHAEFFGGGAHCCPILNDVRSQIAGPFL